MDFDVGLFYLVVDHSREPGPMLEDFSHDYDVLSERARQMRSFGWFCAIREKTGADFDLSSPSYKEHRKAILDQNDNVQ
jgi:hypothetical protein